ncbi:hypothetical protein M2324_000277 [Rhodovulum sulfidophilum]|uniref:hypothetical protein n=1 Tax=Rhodovulum sulfidophilum TaxID=35806 RepID=UPI001E4FECB7|nr:hypothetical protein [Rhodovulum sulfidophilum]MCW2301898.1 hypothetical protein [Rhodovulum sulfidophilum]
MADKGPAPRPVTARALDIPDGADLGRPVLAGVEADPSGQSLAPKPETCRA